MKTKVYKRGNYALTIVTREGGGWSDRSIEKIEPKPFYPDMCIFGSKISLILTTWNLSTAEEIDLTLDALKAAKKAKAYFDSIIEGEDAWMQKKS